MTTTTGAPTENDEAWDPWADFSAAEQQYQSTLAHRDASRYDDALHKQIACLVGIVGNLIENHLSLSAKVDELTRELFDLRGQVHGSDATPEELARLASDVTGKAV